METTDVLEEFNNAPGNMKIGELNAKAEIACSMPTVDDLIKHIGNREKLIMTNDNGFVLHDEYD